MSILTRCKSPRLLSDNNRRKAETILGGASRMLAIRIVLAAIAFAAVQSTPATTQDAWPSRPIRLMVGFGAGGGTDVATRIVADPLGEVLGQRIVVENKPGAGGT